MPDGSLRGVWAVVLGVSSGIGAACAFAVGQAGAVVALCSPVCGWLTGNTISVDGDETIIH